MDIEWSNAWNICETFRCIKMYRYRVYFDYNVYFFSVYWNNWIYCSYCAKITRYLKCLATSQVDCTLCLWVEHTLSEHLPIWHCFVVSRPSVHLSHFMSTKQYLLNYSVHCYHQKVKIIKQILTFVVRWIRDNIFQAKDVFTSHARWIRLLLEKYYHVFTSTKVNICILFWDIYPIYWEIYTCSFEQYMYIYPYALKHMADLYIVCNFVCKIHRRMRIRIRIRIPQTSYI